MVTSIPELGVVSTHQKDASLIPNDDQHQHRSARISSHQHTFESPVNTDDRDVHVYTHLSTSLVDHAEESEEEVMFHIDLIARSVVLKFVPLCNRIPSFIMQHVAKSSQRIFWFACLF